MSTNIGQLENPFFTIKGTNSNQASISFFDYTINQNNKNFSTNILPTISPQIYQKSITTKSLRFNIENFTIENIKNELYKEYFNIITSLGKKNRDSSEIQSKLDILINSDIEKRYSGKQKSKVILSKLRMNANNIAAQGRLGPGQFIVSNIKTYNNILKNLDEIDLTFDNNYNLKIDTQITYYVNNNIEDDIIIMGRKNNIDQSGIHCIIEVDDNNNLSTKIYSIADMSFFRKEIIEIKYNIFDVGFNPEYQFYSIFTTSLVEQRVKKLNRIKEIYEVNN